MNGLRGLGPHANAHGLAAKAPISALTPGASTPIAGWRRRCSTPRGRFFKRHLAVLTGEGEALPMGSLAMTPAEFAAVTPAQRV